MFTGIVEATGRISALKVEGGNLRLTVEAPFAHELREDQSVAHNGACLTVEKLAEDGLRYEVVAIEETLSKTNLGRLSVGELVNLERCLRADSRIDGHFVQGHVDRTTALLAVDALDGSWLLHFELPEVSRAWIVPRGSVALNGVSLTVADLADNRFTVAIIPYTWEHTNLSRLMPGDLVNVEFDWMGKYVVRWLELRGM